MVATGGNNLGIIGAIPDGPSTSRVCLKVGKVFADGSETTSVSALIQGKTQSFVFAGCNPRLLLNFCLPPVACFVSTRTSGGVVCR